MFINFVKNIVVFYLKYKRQSPRESERETTIASRLINYAKTAFSSISRSLCIETVFMLVCVYKTLLYTTMLDTIDPAKYAHKTERF